MVVDVVVFKLVIDVCKYRINYVTLKHIILICKYNLYIGINNKFLARKMNAFKKTWFEEIEHSLLR